MTYYCTLIINSDINADLPPVTFLSKSLSRIEFTDNQSPVRQAFFKRISATGFVPIGKRYWWELCTDGYVTSEDIHVHLFWLIKQLRKGKLLTDLHDLGYEYWFSFFWQGNGTGGGPVISLETTSLLTLHKAELSVSFYVE